jgi:hypothetical protein
VRWLGAGEIFRQLRLREYLACESTGTILSEISYPIQRTRTKSRVDSGEHRFVIFLHTALLGSGWRNSRFFRSGKRWNAIEWKAFHSELTTGFPGVHAWVASSLRRDITVSGPEHWLNRKIL